MNKLGYLFFLLLLPTLLISNIDSTKVDSIKQLVNSDNEQIKAGALIQLANIYQPTDSIAAAYFYNEFKAINIEEVNDTVYRNLKAQQLEYLQKTFNFREGINTLLKSIDKANSSKDLKAIAFYHQLLAPNYFFLFQYDSCNYHLDKSMEIYARLKDTSELGGLMIRKSGTYYALGDYEKAIQYAFEATELLKASKDKDQLSVAYLQLGNIFYFLSDFEEAERYFELSLESFKVSKNDKGYYRALSNLGLIKIEQGKFKESIPLQLKAVTYFKENRQELELGNSYQYLSGSYEGLAMYDSAYYYNNLAIESIKKTGYLAGLSQAILMNAKLAMYNSEFENALGYALRSYEIADSIQHHSSLKSAAFQLSTIHEKLNNPSKSLYFLKIANRLRDSLDIDPNELKKYAKKHRLQIENYETELLLAKEKSEQEKEKSAKQESQLFLAITIAFVSSFLLFIAIFYLIKNKRLTKELALKQQKIKEELEIKESLLGEIHHRVKNNLQVISSMLSLQSRYIQDNNFQKIISDCKSRISSMSLIHESLYKKVDGKETHFSKYIKNLIPRLIKTYQVDESKVKLKMDLQDIYLDLDESIPCGLIINEIVSNSLKHAFVSDKGGVIFIELKKTGSKVLLKIADNGVGFKEKEDNLESFGFLLIDTLTKQLEADISIDKTQGVSYTITWESNS